MFCGDSNVLPRLDGKAFRMLLGVLWESVAVGVQKRKCGCRSLEAKGTSGLQHTSNNFKCVLAKLVESYN